MKSATPALIALLGTGIFVLADLYTFTLANGTILRVTTADRDIAVAGSAWASTGPFADASPDGSGRSQAATRTQKIGLDVDSRTIAIHPRPADPFSGAAYPDRIGGQPFLVAVAAGAFDGGQCQVDRAYWPAWPAVNQPLPAPTGVINALFLGRVAGIELDRGVANITINSHLELLTQQVPRNFYGPSCRHTLFDAGCTLSQAGFGKAGTVATIVTQGKFTSAIAAPAGSATYALGRLTFTSGLNAGVMRFVRQWDVGSGTFTLIAPAPYALQVGDSFTVYPGCDKTQNTCRKFANLANFGGQPYIPVIETSL